MGNDKETEEGRDEREHIRRMQDNKWVKLVSEWRSEMKGMI
jgi:hypothetical protein